VSFREPRNLRCNRPAIPSPTVLPAAALSYQTIDEDVALWNASAGWQLSAENAFGGTGLGWRSSASGQQETLTLGTAVSVGMGPVTQLRFRTRLVSAALPEVRVSSDGVHWQTLAMLAATDEWVGVVIDLSPYQGQTVYLQFDCRSPVGIEGEAIDLWQVDDITIIDLVLTTTAMPTAAMIEMPSTTETPVPTQETEMTTEVILPTAALTPTPTAMAAETSTEIVPLAESPLSTEPSTEPIEAGEE